MNIPLETISDIKNGYTWTNVTGRPPKPIKSALTDQYVKEIVALLATGKSLSQLAKRFNVSKSTIHNIKTGKHRVASLDKH